MINSQTLDGITFAGMVKGGAARLYAKRSEINELNVFPIPDGDTGDNMYMTIRSGCSAEDNASLERSASDIARGMLLGARGNSGVILSRIFAGIADGFSGKEEASPNDVSAAFLCGVERSYGAVSNPVEGTILTVFREAAEYAAKQLDGGATLGSFLDDFIGEAERSLERTPDLLSILKEAGVVDSGGAGLLCIAEGMAAYIHGEDAGDMPDGERGRQNAPDLSLFTEDSVLEYGYCTEFLLRLQRAKTDIDKFDIDDFTSRLCALGDSVVSFRDGTIVKVHVHTKTPADILTLGQEYGEFLTLKIENMTVQHHEAEQLKSSKKKKPHKKYAVVTVGAGDGIRETFLSLGADVVINGGQCMNPSASDFVEAFESIDADTIFVFPSNGNIVMTASQAAELYKDADVRVIPCKTIGETYAALSMLDTTLDTTDAIVNDVTESFAGVVCGSVSRAIRDSELGGVNIHTGDYIGFCKDTVYTSSASREEATLSLAEKLNAGKFDILLLICGEDADDGEAKRVFDALTMSYKRTEVIMINGGQPVHDYLIVLE